VLLLLLLLLRVLNTTFPSACLSPFVEQVVLTDERFQHLRRHVGRPTVYWSHVRREPVVGKSRGVAGSTLGAIELAFEVNAVV
jgi:hypothetical protein